MAIADPLSRLSRQEHRVDNLDLTLLLEMLLTELPEEIRGLEHFRVNAEKDTNVATRTSNDGELEATPSPTQLVGREAQSSYSPPLTRTNYPLKSRSTSDKMHPSLF